ncbi:MAG: HAD-IA family hydrolase [Elusimicrobia bacterium]|nr:HAD-IA family hydrolase [Elusimicrobiota bacterium]
MKGPRAVILDMDGVMVDSERHWRLSEDEHIRRLLPAWCEADTQAIVGLGVVDLYRWLVKNRGLKTPEADFLSMCDRMAADIYGSRVAVAPDLGALLGELKRRGLKLGLASSSPAVWVGLVLDRFGLRADFSAVATGDETPGRTKPDPDLYLLAAARLGVAPAACAAVEDSRYGVQAAKSAGMRCVAYRGAENSAQDLSAADAEVGALRDVPAALERLAW